jgi:hypothetical protein
VHGVIKGSRPSTRMIWFAGRGKMINIVYCPKCSRQGLSAHTLERKAHIHHTALPHRASQKWVVDLSSRNWNCKGRNRALLQGRKSYFALQKWLES